MTVVLELSVLATPKSVPELRHSLRHHGDDVRLCATELLTNVIDHVGEGAPVTVRLVETGRNRARVEVTDPDPHALPLLLHAPAAATDEHGRGFGAAAAGVSSKVFW